MPSNPQASYKPIRRTAMVGTELGGTELIGASCAAEYFARGFEVIATELTVIGLAPKALRKHLEFTANMKEAMAQVDFVQENRL